MPARFGRGFSNFECFPPGFLSTSPSAAFEIGNTFYTFFPQGVIGSTEQQPTPGGFPNFSFGKMPILASTSPTELPPEEFNRGGMGGEGGWVLFGVVLWGLFTFVSPGAAVQDTSFPASSCEQLRS